MTLVITDKDMIAFDKLAQQQFMIELYKYCESSYPQWVKKIGKSHLENAITGVISSAKKMGLRKRSSIYLLLNICFLIGGVFYQDNQYNKVKQAYEEASYLAETERVELLYQGASIYMTNVEGNEGVFIETALAKLKMIEHFRLEKDAFDSGMLSVLRYCYPEKVTFLGEEMYLEFIKYGQETAKNSHSLHEIKQQANFIILQFFLGQHFERDPFVAWFGWPDRLEDIVKNQFSFKTLANQLQIIRELNVKESQYGW